MEPKILQVPHGYNQGAELELCPSITTSGWEANNFLQEPKIMAMRGRACLFPKRTEYGKQIRKKYESGEISAQRKNIQRLEPRKDDLTNTITSVQKDNLVAEQKRVRKLTPLEVWRLMGASDEDYHKAVAAGVSKTQLYRQAGNGIVKHVLMAIFGQLYGIDWKPLVYGKFWKTEAERINELPILKSKEI